MPIVTPAIDLLSAINLLGAVQGIFLAFIFFSARKNNRYSNYLLAALLFCISVDIFEIFLCYTDYIFYVPWMVNLAEPYSFLYGPLIYFYVLLSLRRTSGLNANTSLILPLLSFISFTEFLSICKAMLLNCMT
jgi:hypothetical protein